MKRPTNPGRWALAPRDEVTAEDGDGRRPTKPARWVLALVLGVTGFTVTWPLAAQTRGACEDEAYRALDFLLGEWRLVSGGDGAADETGGAVFGRSRVEKLEGGCLVAETWALEGGESGRTYSTFDRAAGVWRRFSVSNRGMVVRSSGSVEGGALVLRGERVTANGPPASWSERLTPVAGGRVAHVGGFSLQGEADDRSMTIEGFSEYYYDPMGRGVSDSSSPGSPAELETALVESPSASEEPAALATASAPVRAPVAPAPELAAPEPATVPAASEPADAPEPTAPERAAGLAAAEPADAPEPAAVEREAALAAAEPATAGPEGPAPAAGEVTAASARASDADRIERIAMASPMVLRLPLGPVEALPRDYAWITRDTAPYLCEGVTIERLEVARRRRRGQVELEVELAMHGRQVSRAVNVGIALHRSGQTPAEAVVASGAASGRVGRSIPEQVQYGSVAVTVRLSMDVEVFNAVAADPERPDLVITLSVGK